MAATIRDKYALYLLHLFVGVMNEEVNDLMRYGIPPIGVGRVTPLKGDLRQKIFDLFTRIDETVKNAALTMIEDSISTEEENDILQWLNVMLEELKKMASSLGGHYENEMKKASPLLIEIGEIIGQAKKKTEVSERNS